MSLPQCTLCDQASDPRWYLHTKDGKTYPLCDGCAPHENDESAWQRASDRCRASGKPPLVPNPKHSDKAKGLLGMYIPYGASTQVVDSILDEVTMRIEAASLALLPERQRAIDDAIACADGARDIFEGDERPRVHLIRSDELRDLKSASSEETFWVGLLSSAASLFVGAIMTWVSSEAMSPARTSIYVSIVGVLALSVLVCGRLWWSSRRKNRTLIDQLEKRANVIPFDFPSVSLRRDHSTDTSLPGGTSP